MNKLNLVVSVFAISIVWLFGSTVRAQTYTVLYSPAKNIGGVALDVQGADGNIYGGTYAGGTYGDGTIFTVNSSGQTNVLHSFDSADGMSPSSLILGSDENFYGTAAGGGGTDLCTGGFGCGTVFRVTPDGNFTTLQMFDEQDGGEPLVQVEGFDGNLYGVTDEGGTSTQCVSSGCGTIYSITAGGEFTTLVNFDNQDGFQPSDIIQGADGNFYGTTMEGGAYGYGEVFQMTPDGALTTIYSFCAQSGCPDGQTPGALMQDTDGNFYGVASFGGHANQRTCSGGCGTFFMLTPWGTFTMLHDFCLQRFCADGADPIGIIHGSDGNFYGVTELGGTNESCNSSMNGCGTIFRLTSDGALTTLYSFCAQADCADGYSPETAILQDTNGTFYGSTESGGQYHRGVVYSVSVGLGPFVEANPAGAAVGAKIGILGTDLTGATAVTFNGIAAEFKVVSPTLIGAKVPSGATSGTVQVQLPSGTLSSNVPFVVLN